MHTIKEVLRLTAAGLSQRQIAHNLDLSNGVVAKYQAAAQRASLSWPLPAELDDEALAQRLWSKTTDPADGQSNSRRPPLDFAYLHEQLKRKGVTRQLLWEEYRAEQPAGYSYTQFCFHYQEWKSRLKLVMRQTYRAGEKLFVDYCRPRCQSSTPSPVKCARRQLHRLRLNGPGLFRRLLQRSLAYSDARLCGSELHPPMA